MSPNEAAYAGGYLLALALCWSPFNALGYLAPFAVMCWIVARADSGRTLARLGVVLAIVMVVIGGRGLLQHGFVMHSALLTLITYGTVLFLLAVPTREFASANVLEVMYRYVPAVILLQAGLGLIQAVYGASSTGSFDVSNGDFVEGTIHPQLESERSFSNVMFASNMAFHLLLLVPLAFVRRRGWLAVLAGSLAFVLASVLHVFLFLTIAVVVAFVIFRPPLPRGVVGVMAVVALIGVPFLAVRVLQRNFAILPSVVALFGESPKARFTGRVVQRLPDEYPYSPFVGVGPGQLGSRASLIGTGLYFGTPTRPKAVPLLSVGMSTAFNRYALDLWLESSRNPYYGSTQQPFSSWVSTYAEWGIGAVVLLIGITALLIITARRRVVDLESRLLGFAFAAGALLLLLLGFQENYWEVPQAVFLGTMQLKLQYGMLSRTVMTSPGDA